MTIAAWLMVALLAIGNGMCAMTCAAQPDTHSVPPCHQKPGPKVCRQAPPIADLAIPAIFDSELPLLTLLDAAVPQAQTAPQEVPVPSPRPFALRI